MNTRIFAIVVAGTILIVAAVAANAAEVAYLTRIREATDLLRQDAPRQAEDESVSANLQDFADPLAWLGLGGAHLGQGDVDGAMDDFARAVELAAKGSPQARPAARPARLGRAICLIQRGQVQAAREELSALSQEGFTSALAALAYAELVSGDHKAAEATIQTALQSYPDDPLALVVLSRLTREGNGIALAEKALKLCPGSKYAAPMTALALPNTARPAARTGDGLVRLQILEGPPRRATVTWLGDVQPSYVVLKLDGHDVGVSNVAPHEFGLPRDLAPGPHGVGVEVRRDGSVLARAGTVIWSSTPGEPPNRYDDAEYGAALEGLRAALMPIPNLLQLHYWLAGAYAPKDRAGALRHYERVVALDPAFADARQRLAGLCASLGLKASTRAIYNVPGKRVCITFDDGPHPLFTERILKALRAANVRATFFVMGTQARTHPELVRAIAAAGHEIANHSYSHDDLARKSAAEVQQELLRTQVVVEDATGRRTRLFRPPGGRHTADVRAAAAALGYRTVLWSSKANISICAGLSPQAGVKKLMQEIKPGSIVLLHNGPDESADVLPGLLAALKKRGYTFSTVSGATGK